MASSQTLTPPTTNQGRRSYTLLRRLLLSLAFALFGLFLARAILYNSPQLIGSLPLWLPIVLSALAFAAIGYRLSYTLLPTYSIIPLILISFFGALNRAFFNPSLDWLLILGALGGFTAVAFYTPERANRFAWVYPVSLAIITSVLYLRTLAPTVGEADTFEFQVNVLKLAVSHGSGYPLYILLAKLFSLLPLGGTAAFRINLSAAFFGVTAVLMCYALARIFYISRPAAWIASLTFAVSYDFWSRAVEAEVYTLHVTLVAVLLWLAFYALDHLYFEIRGRFINLWYVIAFVFGLSLTNHLTTILLAPVFLIVAIRALVRTYKAGWWKIFPTPQQLAEWVLVPILFFLLGLSVYLYLPIRWPAVNNGEIMSWGMFMHFFTGAEAQGALRLNAWYTDLSRYEVIGRKVLSQFSQIGVVLALYGLYGFMRSRIISAIILAAWGAFAFFGLSFYVPDPDYSSFLLPAHLIMAVCLASGIMLSTFCAQIFYPFVPAPERPPWQFLSALPRFQSPERAAKAFTYSILFTVLPVFLIYINLPRVDQSADWREYRLGQYILSQPLKEGAAILADSELIAPLYYLQVAEGIRPDLDIIVLPAEEYYRDELDWRMSQGQPVYLGRYLPHLADAYYLHSLGPLTEAKFEPSPLPADITSIEATFGDTIQLHGFHLDSATTPTNAFLPITLYWQALQPPPANYRVVLRLLDSAGQPVLTAPASVPVGQLYPTSAWPLDDVVSDFHAFQLERSLPPGSYQLQVGLFPAFSEDGLLTQSGEPWQTLTSVALTAPTEPPTMKLLARKRFGPSLWLMGYDRPLTAAPGSRITATLYWQTNTDTTVEVCFATTCQPILVHAAEGITETQITSNAPTDSDRTELFVSLPGGSAECSWWPTTPVEWCWISAVSIQGAALAEDAINFDNQIVMDKLTVETPQSGPGQVVIVSAQWRGLKPMTDDYTVFVHLLGPDGLVHGQVDMWPVQGTLPTTQWQTNTPIADRFEIRVPDDAPLGEYKVEVGWYLLATLDRLPVVDTSGVIINDNYLTDGLVIK